LERLAGAGRGLAGRLLVEQRAILNANLSHLQYQVAVSALGTVKRETGGCKWPLVMAGHLFALAYMAPFVTYRAALALGCMRWGSPSGSPPPYKIPSGDLVFVGWW
jgi:hypothetical protein